MIRTMFPGTANAAAKLLPYFFAKVKTPYNDPSRYNPDFYSRAVAGRAVHFSLCM